MSTAAQKAFFKSLADFARSTANLLDEMGEGEAPVKAEKPATKKANPTAAAPAETAKVETKPAAEPAKAAPVAAANGAGDLMADTRKAAKAYAEVYGREGLKEVLSKFTDKTLADVPADKLPELLKALS